jgi:hypothetical protein
VTAPVEFDLDIAEHEEELARANVGAGALRFPRLELVDE